jgi:hypothetical protein
VFKSDNIQKVLLDGVYDSKDNLRYPEELKITPVIKGRYDYSI